MIGQQISGAARVLGLIMFRSRKVPADALGVLCLIVAPLLWGGNFFVGDLLAADVPGLWMNVIRWCIALCVLAPFCCAAAYQHKAALWRGRHGLLVQAMFGITGFNAILYMALSTTSMAITVLAFASTPLLTILLNSVLTRQAPSAVLLVSAGIAFGGIALSHLEALSDPHAITGIALSLLAALVWSCYSLSLSAFRLDAPAHASFFAQIVIGTALALPVALLFEPAPDLDTLTTTQWAGLVYVGLGAGALAFWLWGTGMRLHAPSYAAVFMNLVPVSSMAFAALSPSHQLMVEDGLALICVLGGVALAQTARRTTNVDARKMRQEAPRDVSGAR